MTVYFLKRWFALKFQRSIVSAYRGAPHHQLDRGQAMCQLCEGCKKCFFFNRSTTTHLGMYTFLVFRIVRCSVVHVVCCSGFGTGFACYFLMKCINLNGEREKKKRTHSNMLKSKTSAIEIL